MCGVNITFECAPQMSYNSASVETFNLVLERVNLQRRNTHTYAQIIKKKTTPIWPQLG